jgi:hypothetical protein
VDTNESARGGSEKLTAEPKIWWGSTFAYKPPAVEAARCTSPFAHGRDFHRRYSDCVSALLPSWLTRILPHVPTHPHLCPQCAARLKETMRPLSRLRSTPIPMLQRVQGPRRLHASSERSARQSRSVKLRLRHARAPQMRVPTQNRRRSVHQPTRP